MAPKRASISDIAQELNLAVSTVSRALSGHSRISEATRQRVWKLAEQLKYQPNHLAAALRKGRSNTLGVIVPNIDGHFFALVVKGVEEVANKAGYNVMLCQSNEDNAHEAKNVETLMNAQVDGILVSLSRSTHDFKHFDKAQQRKMPLVFFDRILNGSDVSAVVVDDYLGAYQMTKHLLDQGRRRIAHFGGPQHLNIYKDRYLGYCQALRDAGLPVEEERVVLFKDMSLDDGPVGIRHLLALEQRPDAIFSAGDFTAVGALQALKKQGLRVPEDMALAGFGNETFSSLTDPMLSTVDQLCEEMGGAAVRLLLEMIQERTRQLSPRKIVLQPKLLKRESSGVLQEVPVK